MTVVEKMLKGVYFLFAENELTLVATDGRRLAVTGRNLEVTEDAGGEFILPSSSSASSAAATFFAHVSLIRPALGYRAQILGSGVSERPFRPALGYRAQILGSEVSEGRSTFAPH